MMHFRQQCRPKSETKFYTVKLTHPPPAAMPSRQATRTPTRNLTMSATTPSRQPTPTTSGLARRPAADLDEIAPPGAAKSGPHPGSKPLPNDSPLLAEVRSRKAQANGKNISPLIGRKGASRKLQIATNRIHGFVIRFYDRGEGKRSAILADDDYHAVSDLVESCHLVSRKQAQNHLDCPRSTRGISRLMACQTVEVASLQGLISMRWRPANLSRPDRPSDRHRHYTRQAIGSAHPSARSMRRPRDMSSRYWGIRHGPSANTLTRLAWCVDLLCFSQRGSGIVQRIDYRGDRRHSLDMGRDS